jgi:hypothetical protein
MGANSEEAGSGFFSTPLCLQQQGIFQLAVRSSVSNKSNGISSTSTPFRLVIESYITNLYTKKGYSHQPITKFE